MESADVSDVVSDGVGIGKVAYRGRAVVAVEPEDAIARLEPGDVLVTTTTTPAFNCVLPVAGALVTAHGGLMSHAGIAARELGIPAVLGVADALVRIPDGAEVEVDPVAATVKVMG
jgi:pyruvate,water dikinase